MGEDSFWVVGFSFWLEEESPFGVLVFFLIGEISIDVVSTSELSSEEESVGGAVTGGSGMTLVVFSLFLISFRALAAV